MVLIKYSVKYVKIYFNMKITFQQLLLSASDSVFGSYCYQISMMC